jgi:ribosomal-protein-alanine N-acetyltransferase
MTGPDASSLRIRPALLSDLEALTVIDRQCFSVGIAWPREELAALLSSESILTLVAEHSREVAGFTCLGWKRPRHSAVTPLQGELVTIDVLPQWQRKGIGEKLYRALEQEFHARGGVSIELHVAVDNQAAIAFYQRLRYQVIGHVPRYYLNSLDAWRMKKSLLPKVSG